MIGCDGLYQWKKRVRSRLENRCCGGQSTARVIQKPLGVHFYHILWNASLGTVTQV
jgi:hypothetical protein